MFLLPNDAWEIRDVPGKGKGVFATKPISAGVVVGDYLGKVLRPQDEDGVDNDGHFYLMYYHDNASIYPDLSKPGLHLINHSCTPNTWLHTYKGHTLYFAIRHVFPGEEITVSYQLSEQDKDCNPCSHICECDGIICVHTMHLSKRRYEEWAAFQEVEEKKTKRERVRFGKDLPPLQEYPKNVPDNPIYTLFGAKGQPAENYDDRTFPDIMEIRRRIRETGRYARFTNLNATVFGVFDHFLVAKTNEERRK